MFRQPSVLSTVLRLIDVVSRTSDIWKHRIPIAVFVSLLIQRNCTKPKFHPPAPNNTKPWIPDDFPHFSWKMMNIDEPWRFSAGFEAKSPDSMASNDLWEASQRPQASPMRVQCLGKKTHYFHSGTGGKSCTTAAYSFLWYEIIFFSNFLAFQVRAAEIWIQQLQALLSSFYGFHVANTAVQYITTCHNCVSPTFF